MSIYVLELNGGKYYIGKSDDVISRYTQHVNGQGSEWTKLYAPIKLVKTFEVQSEFDEDNTTKSYMRMHGIDNVRGGSYCQINLPEDLKEFIQRELNHSEGKCLNCGGDHFIKDCTSTKKKVNKPNYCLPCFDVKTDLNSALLTHNMISMESEKMFKSQLEFYKRNLCENSKCMNCDHLTQRIYYLEVKKGYNMIGMQGVSQIIIRPENIKRALISRPHMYSETKCSFCDKNHKDYSCPIITIKHSLSNFLISNFNEQMEECFYCKGECEIFESGSRGKIHPICYCPKYEYDLYKDIRCCPIDLETRHLAYVKTYKNTEDKQTELKNIKIALLKFRNEDEGRYLMDSGVVLNDKQRHSYNSLAGDLKRYNDLLRDVCDELRMF